MADPYNLQRFIDAQDELDPFEDLPVYECVVAELSAGRKASHWMWFIFPQLRALGRSTRALYFGISSREEAGAYLRHDTLGPRLRQCTRLVRDADALTARNLVGEIDALKLKSSMTLFAEVADDPVDFDAVLAKFYGGDKDIETLRGLGIQQDWSQA